MSERENIESARNSLRTAESEIRQAIAKVRLVVGENAKEGRAVEANAAFQSAALLTKALAEVMDAHAKSTDILLRVWPGYAGVVTSGPGR